MFKFAPFTQEVLICLRCQYRLGIRSATRRAPQYPTVTPQQLRHFALSHSLDQEQSLLSDNPIIGKGLVIPTRKLDSAAGSCWEEPHIKTTLPGRNRKQLYYRWKDSLGLNALGEPAEVLLLKDREDSKQDYHDLLHIRSKGPDKNPAFEALSSSDMLKEIDGERGLVDVKQACQSLENIKTAWMARSRSASNIVSITEYKELSSQLLTGFSVRQLTAYLKKAGTSRPRDPLDLRNEFASALYTRSVWVPVTSFQQPRAPKLVDPVKDKELEEDFVYERPDKNLSNKPNLVERILRQCWQLKVEKDDASEGELHIRLRSTHLSLITNHKRGILKQISESYGAKIEASERSQLMRITSDYDTCLDIVKVIAFTLGNIQTSEIELPAHLKSHLKSPSFEEPEASVLRQVEKLTNTVIKSRSSSSWLRELHVCHMGPDDADFQDARRLINQIVRPNSTDKGSLIWRGVLNPSQTIPAPVDVGNGLQLMSRNQQWSRWCSPDIRQNEFKYRKPSSIAALNTSASLLSCDRIAADSLNKFFAPQEEEHEAELKSGPCWQSRVSYLDSAVLGQVLFPTAAAEQKAASIQAKPKGAKDVKIQYELGLWRREFLTQVPRMLQMFEAFGAVAFGHDLGSEEFLNIRLTPSFKNTSLPIPIEVLPDLEIRIWLDNGSRTATVRHARLVHSKTLDLLLPQKIVDLRFFRQTCVYWQCGRLDPQIRQFVQDSNLDVWGTERLRTPTELTLEIPLNAIKTHTFPAMDQPATILAEYTFASLEHHSELRIPFREQDPRTDLTYTSIEGGKIGGRRDELALRHGRDPVPNTADFDEESDEDNVAQSAVFDRANSVSLLSKADALINTIESRPDYNNTDYVSAAFTSGVMSEHRSEGRGERRKLGRVRKREKESLPRKVTSTNRDV